MSWTDLIKVSGETLVVDGADDGSVVVLDAAEICGTFDPDGEVVAYEWFLNGERLGSESSMLLDVGLPRDGISEVTLVVTDDAGGTAEAVGYVDRVRPATSAAEEPSPGSVGMCGFFVLAESSAPEISR
jgi:YD repeat-containing protein